MTDQNHYIYTKTVPMATKSGSYLAVLIAPVPFLLQLHTLYTQGHANLYFNQCSIFTEYCFWLRNWFEWS